MREFIALTFIGLGMLTILWAALRFTPRRPGRHSAAYQATPTLPTLTGPRTKPWPTPVPVHVHARTLPIQGEETKLVRPYVHVDDDTVPLARICARRRAAERATLNLDDSYSYAGNQFDALAQCTPAVTA